MSDDQDGCEWVSVSSDIGLPGLSRVCVQFVFDLDGECLVGWGLAIT